MALSLGLSAGPWLRPCSTSELSRPCKRLRFKSNWNNLSQAIYGSCETFESDEESINIDNLEEMKQKLNLISLDDGLLWSSDDSVHFYIQNWKIHYYFRCYTACTNHRSSYERAETSFNNTPTFLTQILLRYSRH